MKFSTWLESRIKRSVPLRDDRGRLKFPRGSAEPKFKTFWWTKELDASAKKKLSAIRKDIRKK